MFDVWPENWPIVRGWCEVADQWRIGPDGRVLGLDWSAVRVLIEAGGGQLDAALRDGLRVMERTTRRIWDAERAR